MSSVRSWLVRVLSHYSSFLAKRHPGQSCSQFSGLLMSRFSVSVIVNVSLTSVQKDWFDDVAVKTPLSSVPEKKAVLLRSGSLAAWNSFIAVLEITLWRRSCDGRVVKALDLKPYGVSPLRFIPAKWFHIMWPVSVNDVHCSFPSYTTQLPGWNHYTRISLPP